MPDEEALDRRPYDLCVIGGGPGGFAAAMRAVDLGKRVVLVEARKMGGAGVYWGALASKTLWELSRDYAVASRTDRGYRASGITVDYRDVAKRVRRACAEKHYQMLTQIETLSRPAPGRGSIELRYGRARFVDAHGIEIGGGEGRVRIEARNFVVAVGSRPRRLPGIDVDGVRVFDSDNIWNLDRFPEEMVIVGAGIIGTEFATMFSNFGQTTVELLDRESRILTHEDEDIAALIDSNLSARGVHVHRSSRLESLKVVDDKVEFVVSYAKGHRLVREADIAMLSIGRVPNTDSLGLERAGVELLPSGHVKTADTATTVPHIHAVGDVNGHTALVNVAELEGRHAVEMLFGASTAPINYRQLSTIMFLSPEVASVGLNEQQCRKAGIPYRVASYSNALVTRCLAMRSHDGFGKMLVTPDDQGIILGMRCAGPQASSAIDGVAYLMDQHLTIRELERCIHPHPSVTEGILECARLLLGTSMYKPEAFPDLLRVEEWSPPGIQV